MITLMICNDRRNEVTKSPRTVEANISYTFVDTDKMRPVLLINMAAESLSDIAEFNYVLISEYNRYYFVDDIRLVRKGLIQITLSCDVLYSWSAHVYAQRCIVERQEYVYNTYISDPKFVTSAKPILKNQLFPSGFNRTDNSYILQTVGPGGN